MNVLAHNVAIYVIFIVSKNVIIIKYQYRVDDNDNNDGQSTTPTQAKTPTNQRSSVQHATIHDLPDDCSRNRLDVG